MQLQMLLTMQMEWLLRRAISLSSQRIISND